MGIQAREDLPGFFHSGACDWLRENALAVPEYRDDNVCENALRARIGKLMQEGWVMQAELFPETERVFGTFAAHLSR